MKVVGLTGGIASGKSTVSRMLVNLGAQIIDADKIAREVVEQGTPAWEEIVAWLGPDSLMENGALNRRWIAEYIFSDASRRKRLEEITHPRILEKMEAAKTEALRQSVAVLVLDVPLLLESGWQSWIDEVWVVYVKQDEQIRRLMKRDGLNLDAAMKRITAQMSLEEKKKYARRIIDNNGTEEETRAQVVKIWREISEEKVLITE